MSVQLALAIALALVFALTNGLHDASNAIAALVATRAARPLQAVRSRPCSTCSGRCCSARPWRTRSAASCRRRAGRRGGDRLRAAGRGGVEPGDVDARAARELRSRARRRAGRRRRWSPGRASTGRPWSRRWSRSPSRRCSARSPGGWRSAGCAAPGRRWTRRWRGPVRGGSWATSAALAFGHGANDAQKSVGVIAALLVASGHAQSLGSPTWAAVACAAALTLGHRARRLEDRAHDRARDRPAAPARRRGRPRARRPGCWSRPRRSARRSRRRRSWPPPWSATGGGRGRWRHVHWQVVRAIGLGWVLTLPGVRGGRRRRWRRCRHEVVPARDAGRARPAARAARGDDRGHGRVRRWADGDAAAEHAVRDCEHRADAAKRELYRALRSAFVTPLEPEDLFALSRGIDRIINQAKDTVRESEVMACPPDAPLAAMAALLCEAVRALDAPSPGSTRRRRSDRERRRRDQGRTPHRARLPQRDGRTADASTTCTRSRRAASSTVAARGSATPSSMSPSACCTRWSRRRDDVGAGIHGPARRLHADGAARRSRSFAVKPQQGATVSTILIGVDASRAFRGRHRLRAATGRRVGRAHRRRQRLSPTPTSRAAPPTPAYREALRDDVARDRASDARPPRRAPGAAVHRSRSPRTPRRRTRCTRWRTPRTPR